MMKWLYKHYRTCFKPKKKKKKRDYVPFNAIRRFALSIYQKDSNLVRAEKILPRLLCHQVLNNLRLHC